MKYKVNYRRRKKVKKKKKDENRNNQNNENVNNIYDIVQNSQNAQETNSSNMIDDTDNFNNINYTRQTPRGTVTVRYHNVNGRLRPQDILNMLHNSNPVNSILDNYTPSYEETILNSGMTNNDYSRILKADLVLNKLVPDSANYRPVLREHDIRYEMAFRLRQFFDGQYDLGLSLIDTSFPQDMDGLRNFLNRFLLENRITSVNRIHEYFTPFVFAIDYVGQFNQAAEIIRNIYENNISVHRFNDENIYTDISSRCINADRYTIQNLSSHESWKTLAILFYDLYTLQPTMRKYFVIHMYSMVKFFQNTVLGNRRF